MIKESISSYIKPRSTTRMCLIGYSVPCHISWFTKIVYQKTDEWYIEWQRMTTGNDKWQWMTTNDNEWQRMTTGSTTNGSEWKPLRVTLGFRYRLSTNWEIDWYIIFST